MDFNPNVYVLNNELLLIKSLMQWRKQPDKSLRVIFKDCYKQRFPNQDSYNSKDLLNAAVNSSICNLLMQSFTSSYEFLKNNIDDKMSNQLKDLRNRLATTASNLNTAKFLDTIRQSFAHNNINTPNPNWTFNEKFEIEINLKNNHFVFKFDELRQVMNEFLLLKQNHFSKEYDVHTSKLVRAIENNKITANNINNFIIESYRNGTKVPFDSYQSSTLYHLFCCHTDKEIKQVRYRKLLANNQYLLMRFLPLKQGAGMIAFNNNITIRRLISLMVAVTSRDEFIYATTEVEKGCHLIDNSNFDDSNERACMVDFMLNDTNLFEITLLSNTLFNMFSLILPNELSSHFDMADIDFRRLRNSIIHGRYFYNNNNGFEFYDGKDNENLTHIATLSVKQINNAISNFVNSHNELQAH